MPQTDERAVTESTADDKRVSEIEAEFPRWQVWISDTGRWWAALRPALTPGQTAAGCVPYLRAADRDELLLRVREQEDLFRSAR
jgi:hypothetical protein